MNDLSQAEECDSLYLVADENGTILITQCCRDKGHAHHHQSPGIIFGGKYLVATWQEERSFKKQEESTSILNRLMTERCNVCYGTTPCHCWNDE